MKIKGFRTSIKTRSFLYFLILVAATVSLLWILQEWFFSAQFSNLSREETVRTLERYTANYNYETDDYNVLLNNLNNVAAANGMVICCFAYKGSIIQSQTETDLSGRPLKYFDADGEFTMEAVVTSYQTSFFEDAIYDANTQSEIIYLTMADSGLSGNAKYIIDEQINKISYASFKSYSDGFSFYFYMESALSDGDVEGGVYRLFLMAISFVAVLLSILLSILFSRLISKPIDKLSLQAGLMASGDYNARFPKSSVKEINDLAQSLDLVADEFGKTEQLRRDFLANITHDFRTPLTLIRGYAELLRDHAGMEAKTEEAGVVIKQKQQKNAQVIIDESMRLANLVDDIQKLSKIQSGTDTINKTMFDINGFLKPLTAQFAIVNIKYGCSVEYVNDAQIQMPVTADSDKIALVMYNLITNAINYADKESPKVIIRLSQATEKTERIISKRQTETIENHFALVEITDNGKGIAPDEINSVWDRYYRANQKKRNIVGTGLGLSIVKSILTLHNAPYGVQSELEKGTTFWFKLKTQIKKQDGQSPS